MIHIKFFRLSDPDPDRPSPELFSFRFRNLFEKRKFTSAIKKTFDLSTLADSPIRRFYIRMFGIKFFIFIIKFFICNLTFGI
jgi:hypothetical protein